ncbi:hypothetical protein [Halanaerobium hydrogeniformans]|uniref:Uncharacterized protein n=1 Tax=Halanaerobium hydrogeniformans TaxID=656519 RepID=E4RPE8_HALHG|nr:hypothetical protein [Halanaerobium hydrogeniformans]ADQ13833.1 hypothetical protein Halsa_0358 [Halanaerobium hydrogeniformans]
MNKEELKKLRIFWITLIFILVVSAFAVPYLYFRDSGSFFGSFLYWIVFVLIVIFSTIKITAYWRD